MEAFNNQLNNPEKNNFKKTIRMSDLELNEDYLINDMRIIKTKYSDRTVIITINDNEEVFLPRRYSTLFYENRTNFQKDKFIMNVQERPNPEDRWDTFKFKL